MLIAYLDKALKLKNFLGDETGGLILRGTLPGIIWFFVELGFAFVLQGFLVSIGLLETSSAALPSWWPTSYTSGLILLVTYAFCRAFALYFRVYTSNLASQSFAYTQKSKILRYSLFNADKISSAESLTVFSDMVGASANVIQNMVMILNGSISSLLLAFVAIKLAPYEFFLGASLLGLLFFPLRTMNQTISKTGEQMNKEWKNSHAVLLTGIRNNFLLSAYNLQGQAFLQGNLSLVNTREHYRRYAGLAAFKDAVPLFGGLCVVAILSMFSLKFIGTKPAILLAFFYIFMRIAQSASDIHSIFSSLSLYWPSFRDLYHWNLKQTSTDEISQTQMGLNDGLGDIIRVKAKNLEYAYPNRAPVFEPLSFEVVPGAPFIIKGPSGVGKSTLLKLILGMVKPTRGLININGFNVSEVRPTMADLVGYVGPEAYFVPGTVRQNLIYPFNKRDITDAEIWSVLRICKLDLVIGDLTDGLDHYLNELTPLSSGQKQRLAMASALLRRPKLLILDEATSNLDSETESAFISDLEMVTSHITTIIVTHRNSFDQLQNAKFLNLGRFA